MSWGQITQFNRIAIAALGVAMGVFVSSCTNNLTKGISTSNLGLGGSGNGGLLDVGNNTGLLSITNVLKDGTNPGGVLDIVGDGTNAMARYCLQSSAGASSTNSGSSTCACTYSYTSPSLGSQQVDVDTVYHESNLIECPYTTIPSDVTSMSVKIHVTTQNSYSNSVIFNLAAAGFGTSPTNAGSFSLVQRFQCKDIISVPYPFGPALDQPNSVYDPIQSEDPSFSYPLNFYTTNLGGAYAQYIAGNVQFWNCPSNPQDTHFPSNYKLYSVGPDAGGSKLIYPTAGSAFDRSTFYVANKPAGVFTVPLNSYIAPTLTAAAFSGSGSNPYVGYGAAPVPAGPSQETCPNAVAIPTGYHWVKVWLFRADLPDRRFTASSGIQNLGSVTCNPGTWGANSTGGKVFDDCGNTGGTGFNNGGMGHILDRILAGETNSTADPVCAVLDPFAGNTRGPGASTQPGGATQFNAFTSLALGSDLWDWALHVGRAGAIFNPNDIATNAADYVPFDPMDLGGRQWGMEFAPKDEKLSTVDIDQGKPRYDFVFVVTPPTVMATDMENSSKSSNYPYTPFRFPNASDCVSGDPDSPAFVGDCDPTKVIHYGLKLHDVGSNGDPPANDPNRAGVFPMCALQPN